MSLDIWIYGAVMNLPFGTDTEAADEWIRNWTASVSEQAAQAQSMSDQVAQLSVSATSADGAIEVTVGGSGVMSDLRLDERTRKWPAAETAAEILAVMRQAQAMLAGRVAEIAAETVGPDSETARAVVSSFERRFPSPVPDDDEDEHGTPNDWRGRGR